MTIFGVSPLLISGIINFLLLLFQLLSGLRIIRVSFNVHKKTGIALFIIATIHGLVGVLIL